MSEHLQWFRLYHRIVDDEKVRLLAFEDRWHFISLCCLKCSGLLDEPDSDVKWRKVALKMGIQARELDEVKRRLLDVDLIDENMVPTAWNELQFRSDTSTERVREYRAKTKSSKTKRQRNVSVTGQETETELEAEREKEKPSVSPKSGMNEDWSLPEDWLADARDRYHSVPLASILAEVSKFRDHYLANGSEFVDWFPKWRNWLRNAFPDKEVSPAAAAAAQQAMAGRVQLHSDDPVFREIARLRKTTPPTDRSGFWSFDPAEVEQARANIQRGDAA